jgi:tyrosine decarboxylase/aspartate 1-decarboxylase
MKPPNSARTRHRRAPKPRQPGLDSVGLSLLAQAVERLEAGFSSLPPARLKLAGEDRIRRVLNETVERLQDNYPYFHPLYAGQMLKPPHPVARLAYDLAQYLNPNNHAIDGGRASSLMEKEAVAEIAHMIGWSEHLGHLCSGGTMANLEALWVAAQLRPGQTVAASEQAHYTHRRISGVLGVRFESIACDSLGRLDCGALERALASQAIGCVVATLGTTATGAVDRLDEIVRLRKRHGFRLHVDAAYGGYFILAGNIRQETRDTFECMQEADSIVIDPHKHGLQPYGCGCVLFRDPEVGQLYKHDSPYTYFTSSQLHLGEISLECSRPGAAAVALWATQRLLPLSHKGDFSRSLEACRAAALAFWERLSANSRWAVPFPPELDIVVWSPRAKSASVASRLSRAVFDEAQRNNLHLALADLPARFFAKCAPEMQPDQDRVTCLRSVLMKPEHLEWIGTIYEILDRAASRVVMP